MFNRILAVIFTIVIIYSCVPEEEPDYNYSINSIWWSDTLDSNQDGYASFKRLNFNIHLLEQVNTTIDARIYYKLSYASDFSFYGHSDQSACTGGNADNNFFISIGSPNKELARGFYDFKIEIYERGSDREEAHSTDSDSLILNSNAFEKPEYDNSYTISASWTEAYDRDQNGYPRYAKLNINADNDADVERSLDAFIYYKEMSNTDYSLYTSIKNFSITGQATDDTVSAYIGKEPNGLAFGEYDFRIDLFEAGKNVLLAFADEELTALNDVKFETEDEDSYYYSFGDVWWSDSVDADSDTFTQLRKLHFDVNVDRNETHSIFAKIFARHADSTDYEKYDSTANFSITASNTDDAFTVNVGSSLADLDSSSYDFLIAVYENLSLPDSLQIVERAISGETLSALQDQNFETITQDTTGTLPGKLDGKLK